MSGGTTWPKRSSWRCTSPRGARVADVEREGFLAPDQPPGVQLGSDLIRRLPLRDRDTHRLRLTRHRLVDGVVPPAVALTAGVTAARQQDHKDDQLLHIYPSASSIARSLA